MSDEAQPVRQPPSGNTGLSTQDVWTLVEVVGQREAFTTACGMVGRSVLDYPPGFEFGPPAGLLAGDGATRWFLAMKPSFVVWSHGGSDGKTYTIGAYSEVEQGWFHPSLAEDAPVEVRRHQWLMRMLRLPLPQMRAGVDL